MGSFKDLVVWQKAMAARRATYALTRAFPKTEQYGLTAQMRSASVSVPSNIAEGKGRISYREFAQFAARARGSCYELETQLLMAIEEDYTTVEAAADLLSLINETSSLLSHLIRSLLRQADEHIREEPEVEYLAEDYDLTPTR